MCVANALSCPVDGQSYERSSRGMMCGERSALSSIHVSPPRAATELTVSRGCRSGRVTSERARSWETKPTTFYMLSFPCVGGGDVIHTGCCRCSCSQTGHVPFTCGFLNHLHSRVVSRRHQNLSRCVSVHRLYFSDARNTASKSDGQPSRMYFSHASCRICTLFATPPDRRMYW